MMNFCSYCNTYFLEDSLNHLSSKIHKKNVLKSRTIKSSFQECKNYIEKRSISTEDLKTILTFGKVELSISDFKELEEYLLERENRLGGEKYEKHRRVKIKAFS